MSSISSVDKYIKFINSKNSFWFVQQERWPKGYRRINVWLKIFKVISSGYCRFNPDYRWILTIPQHLYWIIFNEINRTLAWWLECSQMARATWVQSLVESYQRLKKIVLDASLLNSQQYKVGIKGKLEQSM